MGEMPNVDEFLCQTTEIFCRNPVGFQEKFPKYGAKRHRRRRFGDFQRYPTRTLIASVTGGSAASYSIRRQDSGTTFPAPSESLAPHRLLSVPFAQVLLPIAVFAHEWL